MVHARTHPPTHPHPQIPKKGCVCVCVCVCLGGRGCHSVSVSLTEDVGRGVRAVLCVHAHAHTMQPFQSAHVSMCEDREWRGEQYLWCEDTPGDACSRKRREDTDGRLCMEKKEYWPAE